MNKHLLLLAILLLSLNMFSQMTLVAGQSEQGIMSDKSVKANDNIAFAFYYTNEYKPDVYVFENGLAEEVVWEDTPSDFNPHYLGQIGDKYYFFSTFGDDGFLYEYDHISKNTRKISFPDAYLCQRTILLTDEMNEKIYFTCGMSSHGDTAILSFDGANFEIFDSPQNFSLINDGFLFAENLDEILIWYYEDGTHNNGAQLYTFDSVDLTHISNPSNEMISGRMGTSFQNHILLPYITRVNDNDFIYSLYKYEGSSLVEIPGLSTAIFHEIQLYSKEDKVYIALNNYLDFSAALYEYEGNNLSEISISSFSNPKFLTEFDGKDIFSMIDNSIHKSILQAYNGSSFEEITVPENASVYSFAGILNNKLFLGAYDNTGEWISDLYSLSLGETEMQSVSTLPENVDYINFQLKPNSDFLMQVFKENDEFTLYAQNTNEHFQKLDPYNRSLDSFEFQLGDKIYCSFYDSDWISEVFVWDGVLSTPDFNQSQNEIVIHPNPATDFILLEVPNTLKTQNLELSLFSIDGKLIKNQHQENTGSQIEISLENLTNGVYILELKAETTIIRKKLVKK